jgi:tetratricopeptide (TPR) repeat protein
MTKKEKLVIGGFAVIAIIVMAYLYFDNRKLKKENKEYEADNLKLIFDSINRNPDLSEEVKKQLHKLVERFENINPKIANEIVQALQLLQIGQTENAIEDLAKIIENLLKQYYLNNDDFSEWLKTNKSVKRDFHGHLQYCYEKDKRITKIEYDFLKATKSIRNAEDHDLDLNLSAWLNAAGITAAIDGIIKITSFVYPDTTA